MPVVGDLKIKEDERASWFSHKTETAQPHYYKVYLADYDTTVEITPTNRAAQFHFTFPETDKAYLLLDAFFKGSKVQVLPQERKIIGYARNNSGGVPENFHNYFVITFDKDFESVQTWGNGYKLSYKPESEGITASTARPSSAASCARRSSTPASAAKIGRASCRERV